MNSISDATYISAVVRCTIDGRRMFVHLACAELHGIIRAAFPTAVVALQRCCCSDQPRTQRESMWLPAPLRRLMVIAHQKCGRPCADVRTRFFFFCMDWLSWSARSACAHVRAAVTLFK